MITGNHAQSVAHAAQIASSSRQTHIPTFVILPSNCPQKKIAAAQAYGATVLLSEVSPQARIRLAAHVQKATGATLIPPADHRDIVLGQATAIHEFKQQIAALGHDVLDAIIVPSGGGGLLVGAASACKGTGTAVFGAEPVFGGPDLSAARARGVRAAELSTGQTIADGLRTLTGEANWEILKSEEHVQDVCTVGEDEIKDALRMTVEELECVIEPSAAVGVAVALFSQDFKRWVRYRGLASTPVRVGVVITGGNIGFGELQRLVPGLRLRTH